MSGSRQARRRAYCRRRPVSARARSREEITDLIAGGAHIAELEAEIEGYMVAHEGHPPHVHG